MFCLSIHGKIPDTIVMPFLNFWCVSFVRDDISIGNVIGGYPQHSLVVV